MGTGIQPLIDTLTELKENAFTMCKEMRESGMERASEGSDAMYIAYQIALKEVEKFFNQPDPSQVEVSDKEIEEIATKFYPPHYVNSMSKTGIRKEDLKENERIAFAYGINWLRHKQGIAPNKSVEEKCIEFNEWSSNNQFTMYNNIWSSTKIHYSGCTYTTQELFNQFLKGEGKQ